ncbi:LIC12162 family transferase [Paramagnetospirillum magneticum]|uniref:Transferase n=1 Tax=Paramagnetospirillum magneticum (strain ATCC 700264 / AMB-1) TaxID=342108 RepID=Q2WB34_PARM1|nr:LIC12162 family protein [Paramagnetospirillum magneticum]BAE48941.1 hypothetical protein amb0137 [Paramagnetospirillum magneticum AMB-1]
MLAVPAEGRLILTTVPDDFDPAHDVALGPWCFAGVENRHPGWEDLPFADPFPTQDSWVEADRNARRLASALVAPWAARLNRRHSREYGLGFWRVLLLKWLAICVPPLWQRYCQVDAVIRLHGERRLRVELCADCDRDWHILQTAGLIESFADPAIDFRIVSKIVSHLAPPAWVQTIVAAPPWPSQPEARSPLETMSVLRRLLGRLPVDSVPGASALHRILLSAWVAMLPRRTARCFYRAEDEGAFALFPPVFLEILGRVLEQMLPATLRGGFSDLERYARDFSYHPGRLLVDALDTEEDYRRVVQAMAHEKGERLVSVQHGGVYGTARAMMVGAETEYPYHAFLTWGWTAQEDYAGKFVPAPSPDLSAVVGRHHERQGRLVMVGTAMLVHGIRLGWLPKPQHYLSYRRFKLDFLAGLDPVVRGAVHYRPYRRKPEVLKDEDYLRAVYPNLLLVDGNLNDALLSCRLVVIDHPVTTMLAAMAADTPTVLLWQAEAWPLSRQAEPLFQRLRDVGILHHDPATAAAHINKVWSNVQGWWRNSEVQAARRQFAEQYAQASRAWWWDWLKVLARL